MEQNARAREIPSCDLWSGCHHQAMLNQERLQPVSGQQVRLSASTHEHPYHHPQLLRESSRRIGLRATLQDEPMHEYLRAELERLADRPSIEPRLQRIRKRNRAVSN